MSPERVYEFFRSWQIGRQVEWGALERGEQQMLAIGRALSPIQILSC